MGYCFMHASKIKSFSSLHGVYNHNYRKIEVSNADPGLSKFNDELIKLPADENGLQKEFTTVFHDRIKELDYYKTHNIRKNAVLAMEVLTTFSRDEFIDIEEWKKANVEWLNKTFNKASDGKNNVISCVYHADEPGNVHCHAIVIPIDQKGKLNASAYIGDRDSLVELQNSYAEDMEEFGLERGLRGSKAKHKDIKKFYADLNHCIETVPNPNLDETAMEYQKRVLENLKEMRASFYREQEEYKRNELRKLETEKIRMKEEISKTYTQACNEFEKKYSNVLTRYNELVQLIPKIEEQQKWINQQVDQINKQKDKIVFAENFEKKFTLLQEKDPAAAELYKRIMDKMDQLQKEMPALEDDYQDLPY